MYFGVLVWYLVNALVLVCALLTAQAQQAEISNKRLLCSG